MKKQTQVILLVVIPARLPYALLEALHQSVQTDLATSDWTVNLLFEQDEHQKMPDCGVPNSNKVWHALLPMSISEVKHYS